MTKKNKNYNHDYVRARNKLLECISENGLLVGDRLPSLSKLVNTYKIGRFPFQRAIKSLTMEGYLKSVRGSGVYVNKSDIDDFGSDSNDFDTDFSLMESSSFSFSIVEQIELKLAYVETTSFQKHIINEIIDSFQKKNSHISIKLVRPPIHGNKFLHSSDKPDIFTTVQHSLAIYQQHRILFDLSPYFDVDSYLGSDNFTPGLFSSCLFGKELIAVPAYLGIPLTMVNKEAWQQTHSKPIPENWDFTEYTKLSSEFKKQGKLDYFSCSCSGLEFFIGNQMLELWNPETEQLSSNKDDYQKIVKILSIMMENRMSKFHCIGQKHHVANPIKMMVDGECVVSEGYSPAINSLETQKENYVVLPYPKLPGLNLMPLAEYLSVGRWTAYPKECAEFLKFFISEECQEIFARNNRISLMNSVNNKYYNPPAWQNPEWQKKFTQKNINPVFKNPLFRQCMNSIIAKELLHLLINGQKNENFIRESIISIIEHANHFIENFEFPINIEQTAKLKRIRKIDHKYQNALV